MLDLLIQEIAVGLMSICLVLNYRCRRHLSEDLGIVRKKPNYFGYEISKMSKGDRELTSMMERGTLSLELSLKNWDPHCKIFPSNTIQFKYSNFTFKFVLVLVSVLPFETRIYRYGLSRLKMSGLGAGWVIWDQSYPVSALVLKLKTGPADLWVSSKENLFSQFYIGSLGNLRNLWYLVKLCHLIGITAGKSFYKP